MTEETFDSAIIKLEETANFLRGMCFDPRLTNDIKVAIASRIRDIDTFTDDIEESKYSSAGVPVCDEAGKEFVEITTNGTTRRIPADEPVFLLRAQDVCAAETVRSWIWQAKCHGVDQEMIKHAMSIAQDMDDWPVKKVPDLKK